MLPDKTKLDLDEEKVALAAFIIGCLCREGYLKLEFKPGDESRDDYTNAIRLTATILTRMDSAPGNWSPLPFAW